MLAISPLSPTAERPSRPPCCCAAETRMHTQVIVMNTKPVYQNAQETSQGACIVSNRQQCLCIYVSSLMKD